MREIEKLRGRDKGKRDVFRRDLKIDEELMRRRGAASPKVVPEVWVNTGHSEILVPSLGSLWNGMFHHRCPHLRGNKNWWMSIIWREIHFWAYVYMSWEGRNWFVNGARWWDCYFERDVCLFLLGLAYVVHLFQARVWKRNNAFSWRPFFACPLFLPFGELEFYIWKDAVRASPYCSQAGFSQPVAMADAVHGWAPVMALGMSIL